MDPISVAMIVVLTGGVGLCGYKLFKLCFQVKAEMKYAEDYPDQDPI